MFRHIGFMIPIKIPRMWRFGIVLSYGICQPGKPAPPREPAAEEKNGIITDL